MQIIDALFLGTVGVLCWILFRRWFNARVFTPEDGVRRQDITACPICASKNISGLKHNKHWLKRFGPIMGVYTCCDCGYEGPPTLYATEEEYQKVRKHKESEKNINNR